MFRYVFIAAIVSLCSIHPSAEAKVVLASGAGYRSVVDPLADLFQKQTGISVERIYGNMARVTAQAKTAGTIDLVLGDESFLTKSGLPFIKTLKIGEGRLVVIYPKGSSFQGEEDLLDEKISRIAMPQPQKAIYGKAALEYLKSRGIYDRIQTKLIVVATVPQAAAYVLSGEVDLAMINMTHAKKIEMAIGGWYQLDTKAYSPINIITGLLVTDKTNSDSIQFLEFLETQEAVNILSSGGLLEP